MCHMHTEKSVSDVSFQFSEVIIFKNQKRHFLVETNMMITGCYNLQSLTFSTTPSWTRIIELFRQKYLLTALSDHDWGWLFWFSAPGRIPFPRYCFQTHIYNYFLRALSDLALIHHSMTKTSIFLSTVKKMPILLPQTHFSAFCSKTQNYMVKISSPQVELKQWEEEKKKGTLLVTILP